MKYIREYNSYNEIKSICREYDIRNYTINNDGSIDVDGDADLRSKKLKNLPLNFNKVTGYFDCSYNQLTSLEGCPEIVDDSFYCYGNQLTSLKGCPKEVGVHFSCSYNQLASLEGGPSEVGDSFYCYNNQLTSLEGCPKEVAGDFYCAHNQLTSLEGCPKKVDGNFHCHSNKLPKLIMDNYEYIKGIIKWQDEYSIWRKDGSLDEFRFNDMMIDIKNDYDLK